MGRIVCLLLICLWLWSGSLAAWASVDPGELAKAVTEIELLDQMRTSLAGTLEGSTEEPTLDTFKAVCAPVGRRAQAIAQENGWQVRQVALKYRNPNHKPQDAAEERALAEFAAHPDLQGFWQRDERGVRYFRRIDVQASCLVCHGAKDSRPPFIQTKYPQDLAYNFQVGDLRGMYAVIIPELEKALEK
ncbi:MAG: DUF3365 domain-containing protein [Pseudanabaenaceae cyanobacterium]